MTSQASSYTLLSIPNVTLHPSEIGLLSLECINAPDSGKEQHSMYLVVHLNKHNFPIDPVSPISLVIGSGGERTYSIQPVSGEKQPIREVKLVVPCPTEDEAHLIEDIETFDHVLAQYADFSWRTENDTPTEPAPGYATAIKAGTHVSDPSLRGHLVLMDESSGEVVGEVQNNMAGLSIKEDPGVSAQDAKLRTGQDAGPVVLELPPDVYDAYTGVARPGETEGEELQSAREIFVRAVPMEEQDWMTKSATMISQAISGSTSLLITGMTSASTYYIKHSEAHKPSPDLPPRPVTPSAHPALTRAHNYSATAARASSKTAQFVGDLIIRTVGGKSKASTSSPKQTPVIPAQNVSYDIYSPKRSPTAPAYSPAGLDKKVPPPLPPRSGPVSEKSAPSSPSPPPLAVKNQPLRKRERIALSANLVLATVEDSAHRVFDAGSDRLGAVMGHKYGNYAQQNTHLATHTAKNVVLVYVDMSGFARRALIKKVGKEWIKARVSSKRDIPGSTPPPPGKA